MIIKLMLEGEKPLYQQLKEQIIYALATGELKEGETLPSVRQLASSLAINMHTVNKAYNQLADEGFLTIYKGKGAVINSFEQCAADKERTELLKESISVLAAEAKCRGVDKKDFIEMCGNMYDALGGNG